MPSRKYSLQSLLNKIKKPSQETTESKKVKPAVSQDNTVETFSKDQNLLSADLDTASGVEDATTQHSTIVDTNDDDGQLVDQGPFEWLLRHSLLSQTIKVNSSVVNPEFDKGSPKATRQLRYDQYTVGWICALPIELAAAKAMLDELHISLPNSQRDYNTYQLGSIGDHNIVLACLRAGVYGTTSATAVAVGMRSTYPNSNVMPLMVGIGGGVPNFCDLRLGDVVIGTPSSKGPAVVQYDYGKSAKNGDVDTRGTLDKPTPALLSALSHFQSNLVLRPSEASKYIDLAISQYSLDRSRFSFPGSGCDTLYEPECEHFREGLDCHRCSPRVIARKPRQQSDPFIHYGTIGSGNQVIKHARARDRIAARHEILCFEMEAAGVMDHFPCLVIRGICDYCDTHKNKDWQGYASLAAAAVAKDFLSRVPSSLMEDTKARIKRKQKERKQKEQQQKLLSSLEFEDRHLRRETVKRAHSRTCNWILQQPQFLDWTNSKEYESHKGLLWLKGKPGAGKSTIMKYLVDYTEHLCRDSETVMVASFFFNARGGELARSTIGMYRSLIFQIFDRTPVPELLLDHAHSTLLKTRSKHDEWTLEVLEQLLCDIIKLLGGMHLICYIDALNECPEDQIRGMVSLFDQLAEQADSNHLYVCFSSRHYPHISMKAGLDFILENQNGHSTDIISYLNSELRLGGNDLASEIEKEMYAKSGGIFLWIVLVVQILNREYDRGNVHKLLHLLAKIPTQVDDLFKGILTRDTVDLPQLVTSIRWGLYSYRPLKLREFYHAIRASELKSALQYGLEDGIEATHEDMKRFLLSCSKGIMEPTSSRTPTVQFIHETVREFLLQPSNLAGLWPGFQGIFEGESQDLLKKYCLEYWKLVSELGGENDYQNFPFLPYAVKHVLIHAEHAERLNIPQGDFLEEFDHIGWMKQYRQLEAPQVSTSMAFMAISWTQRYTLHGMRSSSFGIYLAETRCLNLLACWIKKARMKPDWPRVSTDLIDSRIFDRDFQSLKTIISADRTDGSSRRSVPYYLAVFDDLLLLNDEHYTDLTETEIILIMNVLRKGIHASSDELDQTIRIALDRLVPSAVELFLQFGATTSPMAMHPILKRGYLILGKVALENAIDCIEILIKHGADINIIDDQNQSPLSCAIVGQFYDSINLLLDHGANVCMEHLKLCLIWISESTQTDPNDQILSFSDTVKNNMNVEQATVAMRLFQQYNATTTPDPHSVLSTISTRTADLENPS